MRYFACVVVMSKEGKAVAEFNSVVTMTGDFDCAALTESLIDEFKKSTPVLAPFAQNAIIRSLTVLPS